MLVPGMIQVPETQTSHYPRPRCSLIDWTFLFALSPTSTLLTIESDATPIKESQIKRETSLPLLASSYRLSRVNQWPKAWTWQTHVHASLVVTLSQNPKCCLILVTILHTNLVDKCQRWSLQLNHNRHNTSKEKDELGVHHSHLHISKDMDEHIPHICHRHHRRCLCKKNCLV